MYQNFAIEFSFPHLIFDGTIHIYHADTTFYRLGMRLLRILFAADHSNFQDSVPTPSNLELLLNTLAASRTACSFVDKSDAKASISFLLCGETFIRSSSISLISRPILRFFLVTLQQPF